MSKFFINSATVQQVNLNKCLERGSKNLLSLRRLDLKMFLSLQPSSSKIAVNYTAAVDKLLCLFLGYLESSRRTTADQKMANMFYAVAKGRKTGVFSTRYIYNNSIILRTLVQSLKFIEKHSDSGKSVKLMLTIFLGLCFKSLTAKKRLKHFSKMQPKQNKFYMLLPEEVSLVSTGNGKFALISFLLYNLGNQLTN